MERSKLPRPEEDIVKQYLEEIGQYPLLSHEELVDAAYTFRAGREAEALLATPDYSGDVPTLIEAVEEGEAARQLMYASNLRLVVSVAKGYVNKSHQLDLLDLVSEGNIGLNRAIEKFDPDKGFRFSTYGGWWIKQAIKRGIAWTGHQVRIPEHRTTDLNRLFSMQGEFAEQGIEPSDEELANVLDIDIETLHQWQRDDHARRSLSLNAPVNQGVDDAPDLIDTVDTGSDHDGFLTTEQAHIIDTLFKGLPERSIDIIRRSYGIAGFKQQSIEEISELHHLTTNRIHQLKREATRAMHRNADAMGITAAELEIL